MCTAGASVQQFRLGVRVPQRFRLLGHPDCPPKTWPVEGRDHDTRMRIDIPLEFGRDPGQSTWLLPPWGHVVSLGVFPLLTGAKGTLELVGTAFSFSKLGFCGTALHSILEVCKAEGISVPDLRTPPSGQHSRIRLRNSTLAVLHHTQAADATIDAAIWPLETVDAFPPTDVAITFPKFQTDFPYLTLPITFDVPRVGSVVKCIGYSSAGAGAEKLELAAFATGGVSVPITYEHTLQVVEARVTDIFVRRFSAGYVGGPCFAIDAEVPHGMSGGPVVNDEGFVCGVVAAGATAFFGQATTLISMLYPLALGHVRFGAKTGPLTLTSTQTLLDLVTLSLVRTDGSERRLAFARDLGHDVVCPAIPKADHAFVHDDFESRQAGSGATRVEGRLYRLSSGDTGAL